MSDKSSAVRVKPVERLAELLLGQEIGYGDLLVYEFRAGYEVLRHELEGGGTSEYSEEIGDLICAEEGHRFGPDGPVFRFCSRCGTRQRLKTGETSKLWASVARWGAEDANWLVT